MSSQLGWFLLELGVVGIGKLTYILFDTSTADGGGLCVDIRAVSLVDTISHGRDSIAHVSAMSSSLLDFLILYFFGLFVLPFHLEVRHQRLL